MRRRFDPGTTTLLLGFATLPLAFFGGGSDDFHRDPSFKTLALFLLDTARLFTLDPVDRAPSDPWYVLARTTAALAVGVGLYGIVSRVVPEWNLRLRLGWLSVEHALVRGPVHVVVCGLGRLGSQLVREFRDSRVRVVAIERDPANPNVALARARGALVIVADARERGALAMARADRASEVFLVSGDDSTNLALVGDLEKLVDPTGTRPQARDDSDVRCFVHLVDPGLAVACRSRKLLEARAGLQIRVFNVFESVARSLMTAPLGTRWAPAAEQAAHYVVIGFGSAGRIFAREAAKLAHFANRRRLRMSVIDDFANDSAARSARDRFLAEHPAFAPALGFDFDEHAAGDLDAWHRGEVRPAGSKWRTRRHHDSAAVEYAVNAEFLELGCTTVPDDLAACLDRRLGASDVAPVVVVAFDDERRNFETACRLRETLQSAPPILVYLPNDRGLRELLAARDGCVRHDLGEMHAFGACEENANLAHIRDRDTWTIARKFHESYQLARGRKVDASADDWNRLDSTWLRSNEEAARHLEIKLHAIGCAMAAEIPAGAKPLDIDALADEKSERVRLLMEIEHNRWMAERLLAGWRWGGRCDDERTRPTMIPWEELTDEQRVEDLAQVRAITRAVRECKRSVYEVPAPAK